MTVASEVSRSGPYSGNGVTTVFDYDFRITKAEYLKVIRADADGNETTLVLNSDYTVSGVGADDGSITMSVAPATGLTITILLDVPFTQEVDLENQGPYFAETIEAALDLAAMRDQQLDERMNRAVLLPASTDDSGGELSAQLAAGILRLADSADEIDTVASIEDDVTTVAGIAGDVALLADNSAILSGTASAVYASEDVFIGDGVDTTWTLSTSPASEANVDVWVGGAIQTNADISVAGNVLTIVPAVANGVIIVAKTRVQVSANDVYDARNQTLEARDQSALSALAASASAELAEDFYNLMVSSLPYRVVSPKGSGVDITAELQAAIDSLFALGGGVVKLWPAGVALTTGVTLKRGVFLDGVVRGDVELRGGANAPVVNMSTGTDTPLIRAGVFNLQIRGFGNGQSEADGIRADHTNRCFIHNVQFYSCRNAIKSSNAWQFVISDIYVDGAGTDESYCSLYLAENYNATRNSYDNNAHVVRNFISQSYGGATFNFRIENGAGSLFTDCQGMAAQYGWYIGENPAGNPAFHIQFMFFNNCQSDTNSSDGWVFVKGANAQSIRNISMSNTWVGLTGPNDANGGMLIDGAADILISIIRFASNKYAGVIKNSSGVRMSNIVVKDYDRAAEGASAILLSNSNDCSISNMRAVSTTAHANAKCVTSNAGSNNNSFVDISSDRPSNIGDASYRKQNVKVNGVYEHDIAGVTEAFTIGVAFGGATTGITYTTRSARYQRIGKRVEIEFYLQLSSKGSAVGAATLTGLPIAMESGNPSFGHLAVICANNAASLSGPIIAGGGPGATTVPLTTQGAAAVANVTDANFTNTTVLFGRLSYTAP